MALLRPSGQRDRMLIAGFRGFNNTMDKIWDSHNRGVGFAAPRIGLLGC